MKLIAHSFGLLLILLVGCQAEFDHPLAQVNNQPIYSDSLAISTQIQLYELEFAHYSQSIEALKQVIASKNQDKTPRTLQFHLDAPEIPRFKLQGKPFWQKTSDKQTHRINLLCSYQSSNCARLVKSLNLLLPFLKGGYELNYFHNPQRFHKFSNRAALSELCLSSEKQKQTFRDYLWQQNGNLTPKILKAGLLQRGLLEADIQTCLNNKDKKRQIIASTQVLKENELQNKMSLWVNDQYISVNHWQSTLFAQLKPFLNVKKYTSQLTSISRKLLNDKQIWLDQDKQHSWISFENSNQLEDIRLHQAFVTPDNILLGWVYDITSEQALIFNNGQLLTLFTQQSNEDLQYAANSHSQSIPEKHEENDDVKIEVSKEFAQKTENEEEKQWASDAERHQARYESAVASVTPQPLSTSWVEEQLLRQSDLERQLNPTEHQVEGHSLLKLDKEDIDGFYQTLGMEPGDVIVRVNDQWIYEGNNPLWDLLQKEEKVTVSLIRKGLPVHLAFSKDAQQ